jgi:hypothetical protein
VRTSHALGAWRLGDEVEFSEKFAVFICSRIGGGEELIAVKDGVCTREKAEGLTFAT